MSLKSLIVILVLVALGAGGFFLLRSNQGFLKNQPQPENKVSTIDAVKNDPSIKDFALQGKVTAVGDKTISFDAVIIKDGHQVHLQKTANIVAGTGIFIKTVDSQGVHLAKASLKDIKIGQDLTFLTQKYPYDEAPINPYRIEITK